MRQIVLDTETTGLDWNKGHRVIEIGAIELIERRPSGRRFQRYLNPERDIDLGAQEVTGLTREFLSDKPLFASIVDEFLAFIDGAELVIHNAAFDVGFLDSELARCGPQYGRLRDRTTTVDSLALARERFPGQRNSLDALCRRLGVDNAHRELHGALLDSELLVGVYLALTSGQGDLGFAVATGVRAATAARDVRTATDAPRRVLRASEAEERAHRLRIDKIAARSGRPSLWGEAAAVAAD